MFILSEVLEDWLCVDLNERGHVRNLVMKIRIRVHFEFSYKLNTGKGKEK